MVLAYDMDRKLVFVNPAVETLTGYSMQELESANFICWIHPDDQARMLGLWDTIFEGKSFHEEEYRLITKDGRVKWAVCSYYPIFDDSGRQIGAQGREFDLTRRKLAETALRHSEEKLRTDEERYRALFENSPFPMWEEDFSEVKRYLDSLREPAFQICAVISPITAAPWRRACAECAFSTSIARLAISTTHPAKTSYWTGWQPFSMSRRTRSSAMKSQRWRKTSHRSALSFSRVR